MAFLLIQLGRRCLAGGGSGSRGGCPTDRLPLLDLPGAKAAGADQNALRRAVDDGADGLKIGHLAAQVNTGNVESDTAGLFGFTATGNFPGLDGSLGTDVTNLSHCNTPLG